MTTPLRIIGTGGRPKLPKAFKRKWVAALRSGKFKQGHNTLYSSRDDAYCCLGVACKVHKPHEMPMGGSLVEDLGEVPKGAIKVLVLHGVQDKLITMNDDRKLSFKRIASYIDRYL
jgi:hypothetical protein